RPEQVFRVTQAGLPDTFPPLRTKNEAPHNLPPQLTSFIGREQVVREVKDLLGATRLLTLTGMGGCGKTRLSLRVAADLLGSYADGGAWFVELAPLNDPTLIPQTIAAVLGLREGREQSPQERVIQFLRNRRLLLLLDNCEHLVDACVHLADTLLRSC